MKQSCQFYQHDDPALSMESIPEDHVVEIHRMEPNLGDHASATSKVELNESVNAVGLENHAYQEETESRKQSSTTFDISNCDTAGDNGEITTKREKLKQSRRGSLSNSIASISQLDLVTDKGAHPHNSSTSSLKTQDKDHISYIDTDNFGSSVELHASSSNHENYAHMMGTAVKYRVEKKEKMSSSKRCKKWCMIFCMIAVILFVVICIMVGYYG